MRLLIGSTLAIVVLSILNPGMCQADSNYHLNIPNEQMQLRELWRTGDDEDSEPIFGVISDLAVDKQGYIYVVDRQLAQVSVLSPEGQFVRNVGNKGDGPGEFRWPHGVFFDSAGRTCILHRSTRVEKFDAFGNYTESIKVPEDISGIMPRVFDVKSVAGQLVAACIINSSAEFILPGKHSETRRIYSLDDNMNPIGAIHETHFDDDPEHPLWSEQPQIYSSRWSIGSDGSVFVGTNFQDYEISVFDQQGNVSSVLKQEYEHRKRSKEEKQNTYDWATINPNGNLPGTKFEIEDFDKDIMSLYCRENNELWVLTSKGCYDRPKGSAGVFDVYDRNGKLDRQVTLLGDASPTLDRYYFIGDNLYVVSCYKSALANVASGGIDNKFSRLCDEPMAVVCYRIIQQ